MLDWSVLRRRHQGYSGARPDVIALISEAPGRVLDVGCGAGVSAALIHAQYPEAQVTGVEPDEQLAKLARNTVDELLQSRVDDPDTLEQLAGRAPYDLIICADVLEHLAEPDQVLRALAAMLTPSGRLITSLPNVRHISTFISLGILGTWPARSRGIHDRTHLRFFARPDILRLGAAAGLHCLKERRNLRLIESLPWTGPPAKLLDFWPLRGFFTFQYLHLWRRNEPAQA